MRQGKTKAVVEEWGARQGRSGSVVLSSAFHFRGGASGMGERVEGQGRVRVISLTPDFYPRRTLTTRL